MLWSPSCPFDHGAEATALVQGLAKFGLRVRVGDDRAADLITKPFAFDQHRADGNVKGTGPAASEIADGARVEAATGRLELVDQLHGADLGRAGDRTAGEQRADHVDRARVGPEAARDGRDQVMDLR